MTQRIKIVFTDLDGTLFNQSHRLSEKNLSTLQELGKKKCYPGCGNRQVIVFSK
jgi:hydroxymethylpyrimidine pyrophosphatase-like HAD family hydrolase